LKDFAKLDNALLCTHCGFCLPVCPTYRAENKEIQSPRGRVSAILALRNGTLTAKETGKALSYCLLCRACHSACPAGVKVGKLVMTARSLAKIAKPWTVRLFHFITDHAPVSRPVTRLVRFYQKSPLRKEVKKRRWLTNLPWIQRLDNLIPELPPAYTTVAASPRKNPLRVALLCGCMARMFYPNVETATVSLMSHLDVELFHLEGFGCCGAPHRESGNRKAFVRQARKVLDRYRLLAEKIDAIVCDTAVCRVTVMSYARLLANDPDYGPLAEQFGARVVDFSALVLARCGDPTRFFPNPPPEKIAFVDHCQTQHASGTMGSPRELLAAILCEQTKLPRSDQCCGAGGDTMLTHRYHSERVRKDKLKAIEESGASIVVGANAGCLLNMEAGLKKAGRSLQVRHLAEILLEASNNFKNYT